MCIRDRNRTDPPAGRTGSSFAGTPAVGQLNFSRSQLRAEPQRRYADPAASIGLEKENCPANRLDTREAVPDLRDTT